MELSDEKYLIQLGKQIEKLYRAKYSNQLAFSDAVGCDPRTIRRVLRGEQNASVLLLRNIARALDVTIEQLLP